MGKDYRGMYVGERSIEIWMFGKDYKDVCLGRTVEMYVWKNYSDVCLESTIEICMFLKDYREICGKDYRNLCVWERL